MSLAWNTMTVNAQPYGVCSVDPASVHPMLAISCWLLAAAGVSAGQRTVVLSLALCLSGVMLWESAGLLQRSS